MQKMFNWTAAVGIVLVMVLIAAWAARTARDTMASKQKSSSAATFCPTLKRGTELYQNRLKPGAKQYYGNTLTHSWRYNGPNGLMNITCHITGFACDPKTKTITVKYDRHIQSVADDSGSNPYDELTPDMEATYKVTYKGEWEQLVYGNVDQYLSLKNPNK